MKYIALERIHPSPQAPRQILDEAELERLTDSLRRHGPLQPVLVRPKPDGRYELIFGLRRFRAARAAGLSSLPALVWEGPAEDGEILALVENLAREDLNPVDEAVALDALRRRRGLSTRALADLIGKSHTYVAQRLRWLQDEQVMDALRRGLAPSNATELMAVGDEDHRHELLREVLDGELRFAALRAGRRPSPTSPAGDHYALIPNDDPLPTAIREHEPAPEAPELLAVRTQLRHMLALAGETDVFDDLLVLGRRLVLLLEGAAPTPRLAVQDPASSTVWRPKRPIRCTECTIVIGPGHVDTDAHPGPAEGHWWCGSCAAWARRQASRLEHTRPVAVPR